MKKIFLISLTVFYSFGTFLLPMGDFSVLCDIPEMYRNCKATEDKDMTPLDFITDHLLNIDGIFDPHNNGDEQRPHSPVQNHHFGQSTFSFTNQFVSAETAFIFVEIKHSIPAQHFPAADYYSKIFRPPIPAC